MEFLLRITAWLFQDNYKKYHRWFVGNAIMACKYSILFGMSMYTVAILVEPVKPNVVDGVIVASIILFRSIAELVRIMIRTQSNHG